MDAISLNLTYFNRLWSRWSLGIILIILVLGISFKDVWLHHPFIIFVAYIVPYLCYFTIVFVTFHIIRLQKWMLWFLILPGIILLLGVYDLIKWYYYSFLTSYHIVFYYPWTEGDGYKLLVKIIRYFSFIMLFILLDTICWQQIDKKRQIRKLQSSLSDIADNALLSGHFLFKLYQFIADKRIVFDLKVLDFFQYVINKIATYDARVGLAEEWAYLKKLVNMCAHRTIEIKGEELVPNYIWNRSIPTLSMMTWVENAVSYSPIGKTIPIVLEWKQENGVTIFTVRNRIASSIAEKGTGRGLDLVNRLFEPLQKDRVHVAYRIEKQMYFVVELKFIN